MTLRCEWPVDEDEANACGAPATWETDDLGDFHHLCEACSIHAFILNDFLATEVTL